MLRVLKFCGQVALVWLWFAMAVLVLTLLGGCDLLVADNPLCEYDCASSSSYARGVP